MDGGQRHSPSGRRVINGSTEQPAYRKVEAPQTAPAPQASQAPAPTVAPTSATLNTAPRSTHTSYQHAAPEKVKKDMFRFKRPLIGFLIVVALAIAGLLGWSALQGGGAMAIDSGKYQAVFFTNGQVYFGKLSALGSDQMKLTDVYYLQTENETESTSPQQATTDQSNVQLIKLGDEIHGPEDAMIISKDQVLFYENLKTDGNVSKSIQQYKTTN